MVITPDGSSFVLRESVAGRLTAFDIQPDGSLTNRRIWAEGIGPDGICIDAEGAIWTGAADVRAMTGRDTDPGGAALRVREGGQILDRIEFDRPGFSYALGGPHGRTLVDRRPALARLRPGRRAHRRPHRTSALHRRRHPQRRSPLTPPYPTARP